MLERKLKAPKRLCGPEIDKEVANAVQCRNSDERRAKIDAVLNSFWFPIASYRRTSGLHKLEGSDIVSVELHLLEEHEKDASYCIQRDECANDVAKDFV